MTNSHKYPIAFLSYPSEADDEGDVSRLREQLERHLRMCTGRRDLEIWQDRRDLQWGAARPDAIHEALGAVRFLIPLMQPLYFTSEACRAELRLFLARERELGRGDFILPIYYMGCEDLSESSEDPNKRELARRQYADWRTLHYADELTFKRSVAALAERMNQAMRRTGWRSQGEDSTAANGAARGSGRHANLGALVGLLRSMFSADELRWFMAAADATADLLDVLPANTVAPAQLFHDAGVALLRRRLVGPDLFVRLLDERPKFAAEIRSVQALFDPR